MKEKIKEIGKKKILFTLAFIVLIIVIILGGALIYNKHFYKRSFSEIENIMEKSARNYMSKNKDSLPKDINETVTLSVNDLVSANEMKELSEYTKDETLNCNGSIIITNINTDLYRYTPILECENTYKTKKFVDYIKENVSVVETGNGLYNLNNELVYRGDNVNNYLTFGENTYRIIKWSNDETVIIAAEKTSTNTWDNRYNSEKKSKQGINDYSISIVRNYLNNLYNGKEKINKKEFLKQENKNLVIAHTLYVGKRSEKETNKNGEMEKGATIENQYIGLLPIYDFLNVSLDKNCNNTINKACTNYNYLTDYYSKKWWTITANSENTHQVYIIDSEARLQSANIEAYIRPVLHLAKDAIYVSGDGSKENPYIVK